MSSDNVQLLKELNRNVNIIKSNEFDLNDELPSINEYKQTHEPFENIEQSIDNKKDNLFNLKNLIKISCLSLLLFFILSIDSLNLFLLQYMNSFLSILIRSIFFVLFLISLLYIL